MAQISIPLEVGVLAVALHLGVSVGWHTGKAMTKYVHEKENKSRRQLLHEFVWKATHHYDSGIALVLAGFILLVGMPPPRQLAGVILVGAGGGMAYDDKADHPEQGILRYIFGRIRETGTSDAKD